MIPYNTSHAKDGRRRQAARRVPRGLNNNNDNTNDNTNYFYYYY